MWQSTTALAVERRSITPVVECVRPGVPTCDRIELTEAAWRQLLGLALTHGWLPAGTTPWYRPKRHAEDYGPADWLHAKAMLAEDAAALGQALGKIESTADLQELWPLILQFAAYCNAGGFVFAFGRWPQPVAPAPSGSSRRAQSRLPAPREDATS